MNIKYTKIFKKLIASVLIITLTINMPIQSKIKDKTVKAEIISKQTEWNIKCINAEKSYEESKNLKKIKVAILDSGLDFDPDIQAVEKKDFLGDEELHPLYQDMTGHGTSVASLICAKENEDRVTGIAANVDLYVARILDKKNDAPVDRVINAIHWAMSKKVNIIHMSFGTKKYSADLEKAINEAYKAGILIIAAAGNEGKAHEDESNIEYPAAFKNVISVGSTNNMNDLTEFSSTGEELDVVAPGNQVLTAGAFGGVCVESGSSISAAQVTGVAAVLWGKHPEKSNEFIKGLLVGNANKEAITSDDCGNGLIDYEESDKNYSDMNRLYDKYKSDGISEEKAVEKAEYKMPENAKKVTTSEVDYVNASWHKAQHQAAASLDGISEDIINIIKTGAYKPDKVGTLNKKDKHRGWRGMVDNPYFHGRKNYLVNTHYLLCLAKNYINGHPKLPTNKQLRKNQKKIVVKDYEKLVERLKTKGMLNSFFTECQVNTGTNKKEIIKNEGYALLGAAIHNITDAFSHSVYKRTSKKYGKEWLHIVHKGKSTGLLWEEYANDENNVNYFSNNELEFFQYMRDNFRAADEEKSLGIMYELAQKAAQCLLLDALNGKVWYKLFKHKINNKSKGKFRLEKLNINWERLTGEKFDFGLLNPPSKQKKLLKPQCDFSINSKNLVLKLKQQDNYRYVVYQKTQQGKNIVKGTKNKKKKINVYKFDLKQLKNNELHIDSFRGAKAKKTTVKIKIEINYSCKGIKNVKLKKGVHNKPQIATINENGIKFKTKNQIFKHAKKKKFKGWSKKPNKKKVYEIGKEYNYPPNQGMKMTLYPVFK